MSAPAHVSYLVTGPWRMLRKTEEDVLNPKGKIIKLGICASKQEDRLAAREYAQKLDSS
eukprot:CAMPEP_0114321024 /NCGR_PEP_ID=MMETSP0059-20121206/26321_1 /TAXON_ID=36894 /ORGANISM="Pyramimonas parkeae, Strain CCMP726" /LENGTH=58 /DNA_ID=CAMNT_0001448605 /DNA_START=679 /DNA_END=855 /DNA_ORIENTATION=+